MMELYEITFTDDTKIVSTIDHYFTSDGDNLMLRDYIAGDYIDTNDGRKKIKSVTKITG